MQQLPLLYLTQESLTLLETNPQKFQHLYLEPRGLPEPTVEQQQPEFGNQFHLLMKQLIVGLPVEPLLRAYPQLGDCVDSLKAAAPYIFTPAPTGTFKECEHPCILMVEGHLLTVVYDLLIADESKAQIVEWTTSRRPHHPKQLEQNWQTRLYLYVLAAQGDYLPEEISMTYWFVQSPDAAQSLKFTYDTTQHSKTRSRLISLVTQLNGALDQLQGGEDFPDVFQLENPPPQKEQLEVTASLTKKDVMPNLEEIEEVPI